MAKTNKPRVKTTGTTLEIVDLLAKRGGSRIADIEVELGLTPSTIYRHLGTLRENGYVIKEGETYRLSLKFLTIGGYLRRQLPAYSTMKSKIDALAENTGERAQFIVREHTDRVYLYTAIGENPVQTGAQTGKRGPIYASAAGKAILAHLPEDERNAIIESVQFGQIAPNTITTADALRENLEQIRERGYAFNEEESTRGVHAVGTVVQVDDRILGGLSVSGPATRLKRERLDSELLDKTLAASNELELQIQHTSSRSREEYL